MNAKELLKEVTTLASNKSDTPEIIAQKRSFLLYALAMMGASGLWGVMYFAFGESRAAMVPISYAVISLLVSLVFVINRDFNFYRTVQLTLISSCHLCSKLCLEVSLIPARSCFGRLQDPL